VQQVGVFSALARTLSWTPAAAVVSSSSQSRALTLPAEMACALRGTPVLIAGIAAFALAGGNGQGESNTAASGSPASTTTSSSAACGTYAARLEARLRGLAPNGPAG